MPNTEENFAGTTTILFDKLPLDALQTLLATDKTNRKAAIKAIFDRSDAEALQLQENLMKHWLGSAIKPPLDTDSLKTALKRTQSSLHYKILCLLLIHQLKGIEPQIDKKELIDYVSQGIASIDQHSIIAALQTLPTAMTIGKPSKVTHDEPAFLNDDLNKAITVWNKSIFNKYILLLAGKERSYQIEQGEQLPPLKLNFLNEDTAKELTKGFLHIFENSEQLDFSSIVYAISMQGALYPDSSNEVIPILISCLKKRELKIAKFITQIEKAIINPLYFLSRPLLVQIYQQICNPETRETSTNLLIEIGIKPFLPSIMPVLLSLPQLNKDLLDKLINTIMSYSFVSKYSPQSRNSMTILNAILPQLSQRQLDDLFVKIQSISDLQRVLVTHLPNLFRLPQLTQEQFNNLAEILAGEINFDIRHVLFFNLGLLFFDNFFKVLPTFFSKASSEQKSKLITQMKAICVNPKFWNKAQGISGYLQLLPPQDFREVFDAVNKEDQDLGETIFIFPEILTTPQLTQDKFNLLLETLQEFFANDSFLAEITSFEKKRAEIKTIFSIIFRSSYLSKAQYFRWFTMLGDLVQKDLALQALPDALNSPHLTNDQFKKVIDLLWQSEHYPEVLLKIIPAILQASKATGADVEEQIDILLKTAINEVVSASKKEELKDFLYNPLIIAKLVNNPQYLQPLIETLSRRDNFSLELQNFLCHLVISGKITAEQLNSLSTKYSLSKLVPTFTKLYDKSQSLMQNDKENRNSTLNTNTLFGHKRTLLEVNSGEDSSPSHPSKKQGRG